MSEWTAEDEKRAKELARTAFAWSGRGEVSDLLERAVAEIQRLRESANKFKSWAEAQLDEDGKTLTKLQAERDRLKAALKRCRALLQEWRNSVGMTYYADCLEQALSVSQPPASGEEK